MSKKYTEIKEIEICKCGRCGHKWIPRKQIEKIIICPKCKSPYWNRDKTNKSRKLK